MADSSSTQVSAIHFKLVVVFLHFFFPICQRAVGWRASFNLEKKPCHSCPFQWWQPYSEEKDKAGQLKTPVHFSCKKRKQRVIGNSGQGRWPSYDECHNSTFSGSKWVIEIQFCPFLPSPPSPFPHILQPQGRELWLVRSLTYTHWLHCTHSLAPFAIRVKPGRAGLEAIVLPNEEWSLSCNWICSNV